jgi:hypothetical protein
MMPGTPPVIVITGAGSGIGRQIRHATDAVLLMADLPLDANVEFLTIMATNMSYIGRG